MLSSPIASTMTMKKKTKKRKRSKIFSAPQISKSPISWKYLNEAGWTYYSDGGYQAPNKQTFKTGKHVLEYLDHHALPDVYSNLQSIAKTGNEETEEQKKLRFDLIKLMHQKLTKRKRSKGDREGNDSQSISSSSRMSASVNSPAVASHPRRSDRKSAPESQTSTSTVADRGTELYLNKSSKRASKQPVYQPLSSGEQPVALPSIEQCRQMSRDHPQSELDDIQSEIEKNFDDWRFLLTTNHNLLFFGAGSKQKLLHSFGDKSLADEGYVVLIDGFDKKVSVQAILDIFVKLFLDDEEPEPSDAVPQDDGCVPVAGISNPWRAHPLVERAITISRAVAYKAMETLEPIFLIIHNIEGEGLRTDASQEALAALFVNSKVANGTAAIRLVASIDDVDCSYKLWRLPVKANLSWIWKEVHTYRPYDEELRMLEGDEPKQKGKGKAGKTERKANEESVHSILDSLAPKHAEALQILAQLQSDQMNLNEENCWVDYATFCEQCKKKYIITNKQQLQPWLAELRDHRFVEKRKERAQLDELSIPQGVLQKILVYDIKNRKRKVCSCAS